jgi:hypothetical protein
VNSRQEEPQVIAGTLHPVLAPRERRRAACPERGAPGRPTTQGKVPGAPPGTPVARVPSALEAWPHPRWRPQEHAHERDRPTDLSPRRTAQGDRQRAAHGRRSARGRDARRDRPQHHRETVASDTTAAEQAPAVSAVFTHRNMPRMDPTPSPGVTCICRGHPYLALQDERIHYAGQPIALVVAGTLIRVAYEAEPPVVFGPQFGEGRRRSCAVPLAGRLVRRRCRGWNHGRRRQGRSVLYTSDRHHDQMNQLAPRSCRARIGVLRMSDVVPQSPPDTHHLLP